MPTRIVAALLTVLALGSNAFAASVGLGIYPSNEPTKLYRVMETFAAYLSERTGDSVTAVVTRDYAELAKRLKEKSLDLAWINTLNYIRITKEYPDLRYIATYVEKNENTGAIQPYYQSYIVAMKERGFAGLADIRNRTFAFTDLASTSGYAYPNLLLHKSGIDPDLYFKKIFFLKKHDRIIAALRAGSIDAGAVSDGTYFTAVRSFGDRFAVLAKSDPIPLDAIIAGSTLPADRTDTYRKALVDMPPDHPFCAQMRAVLGWSAAGFAVRDDSFYDTAREALGP